MRLNWWHWLTEFRKLWEPPLPEPTFQAVRIFKIQRSIVLPAKLVILAVVFYYLFFSEWMMSKVTTDDEVLVILQKLTFGYTLFTVGIASLLFITRKFPVKLVVWVVLLMGLVDGLFLAAMTLISGGFGSTLFWAFPGLIVINALSIPLGAPQIMLNLTLSAFYMAAGIINANIVMGGDANEHVKPVPIKQYVGRDARTMKVIPPQLDQLLGRAPAGDLAGIDVFLLRLIVLWLLTACCYGVQVLGARQRQVEEEAREFAARQGQLHAAGRLAAEIAHQIKNPLAIINNTAYSLRRALAAGKSDPIQQQIQIVIIQEEIERADRIITQLMGYARLSEGRVEKVNVTEELDRAIEEVFPPAVGFEVRVHRDYMGELPTLVMQREHMNAILVNLLQNAREAVEGRGNVRIGARLGKDFSVEITIQDDGPGIPPEQAEQVFEAYFTTKEKGTGLGLSIVKHNVDLYAGHVHVESELGKGARFVLVFPARTLNQPAKHV